MLNQVDFGVAKLNKSEYKQIYDQQIAGLVDLQQQARSAEVGLVVLVEGWNGAGKGSRISDLIYNLDARATSVSVMGDIDIQEKLLFEQLDEGVTGYYPFMQEFWEALGPRGNITFYDRGWYAKNLQHLLWSLFGKDLGKKKMKVSKKKRACAAAHMQERLMSIKEFETQLVDNGYVVLKLFLHISEEEQKKRLTALRKDPATRWRVSKEELLRAGNYKESYRLYDTMLRQSDFDFAPWTVINAEDKRRANLEIAAALIAALSEGLERKETKDIKEGLILVDQMKECEDEKNISPSATQSNEVFLEAQQEHIVSPIYSRFVLEADYPTLDGVDRSQEIERSEYREQLKYEQKRFAGLELEMYRKRVPLMMMFEGWDAAGKGGAIKRVAQALDARAYTIFPSPAPTPLEKLHPHLWRYWTRLPKAGHVGIYDRSWYGRVLVERVEGFAQESEWARAYDEINAFEQDLVSWGAVLIKFWVDISQEEQLKRFQARQNDPHKQWKITDDDWRNREKYPLYKAAIEDMFRLTSTEEAPWTVLESENKYFARVKALQIVNEALTLRLH